ncbi:MAG: diacylglycerol kinase family protein [Bacteroidales bacterium]|nr:diacylglycerol kinase family protein [Bacteroidales bacterium]
MSRKISFIVNPIAGTKNKRQIVAMIRSLVRSDSRNYKLLETAYAGHAEQLATDSDADVVVAVGGDGTVNEVARALVGTNKTLGILPCGSGDGLALHLGISRNPKKALQTILDGRVAIIDYALCDHHPYFCTCGMGLDAVVSHRFANAAKRGLSTYVVEAFKAWRTFLPEHYIIRVDGKVVWDGDAAIVSVCNANQWGNRALIAAGASVADGRLDVVVVSPFRLWQAPAMVLALFAGKVRSCKKVHCFSGQNVDIIRDASGPIHRDGDSFVASDHIQVNLLMHQLRVIVPDNQRNI